MNSNIFIYMYIKIADFKRNENTTQVRIIINSRFDTVSSEYIMDLHIYIPTYIDSQLINAY